MLWFRKGIVHLLALVLLATLMGMAAVTGFNRNFAHPDKLEGWLTESKIYDHIIPNALDKAQTTSSQDGSDGSVSLSDAGVRQAAAQALTPTFLQQSVNTFLNSNYAWLEGKTTTPTFTIDLTGPKQTFATSVGQLVQSHLAGLPVCTAAQLTQLQLPVDPLTVSCRPSTLDPKTEGNRVAQSITTGDFLNKPVITATSLSPNKDGQSQKPYYQKLSKAPQLYRLGQKLPLILAGVALLITLGILAIAPTRRKGLRRVGATLLLAGVLLIVTKFVSDELVKQFQDKVLNQTFTDQLRQPYHDLLHRVESSLVQTDLYFGVALLVIGLAIVAYLLMTRGGTNKRPKPAPAPASAPVTEPSGAEEKTPIDPSNIRLTPRRQPPVGTPTRKPPRPPRLIQ